MPRTSSPTANYAVNTITPNVSGALELDYTREMMAGLLLRDGLAALAMPVFVLGSIRFGWATPTEAAVVAVFYSLFIGLVVYRELDYRKVPHLMLAALKTSCTIMFLVACAMVSALWGLPQHLMVSPSTLILPEQ